MVVDLESQISKNRGKITALKAAETRDFGAPVAKAKKSLTAVERRAEELDTIAAVLPIDRRDELAELLTDQDVETLRHLTNQGMGDNTLRALTSDLTYLEAWGLAATGKSLPWPEDLRDALEPMIGK